MNIPKDLMKKDMKKLSFVNWDRFVALTDIEVFFIFGWIERKKDNYKDFAMLFYIHKGNGVFDTFMPTSSKKTLISKIL